MANEKILVVDDDADDRELVRRILHQEGYRVEEVTCGQSALESIGSALPDLVISKMFARGIEGVVLVRRIRAYAGGSTLPILAYTPFTDKTKLEALEAGVNDFLTRPFHAIELLARTRALLAGSQALRRIAQMKREIELKNGERIESLEQSLRVQTALLAEAEKARRELEDALNSISDAVVITDAEGRIKRPNGRAASYSLKLG
ncbi:MAG TPA: response regulator [Blastocatellia bacterium]|nr:response regulator [Blastocatellia bacterium]